MQEINLQPPQQPSQTPFGISSDGKQVLLYQNKDSGKAASNLELYTSENGIDFLKNSQAGQIRRGIKKEDLSKTSDLTVTPIGKDYLAVYLRKTGKETILSVATSPDLLKWQHKTDIKEIHEQSHIVPGYKYKDQYVLYAGDHALSTYYSSDAQTWTKGEKSLITYRNNMAIGVNGIIVTEKGILVLYYTRTKVDKYPMFALHALLVDKNDPEKVLWKLESFWNEPWQWLDRDIRPIGSASVKGVVHSYWFANDDRNIYAIPHPLFSDLDKTATQTSFLILNKFKGNPILTPQPKNYWESQATFNPTAIHEQGKTHILYRAVGREYVSVLGYANSEDGIHIDERLNEPAYIPREDFEGSFYGPNPNSPYISGPGWGGCEDPRLTKIDDRIYLTYVAHNGWGPPRVALSSIATEDFLNKNWDWEKPVLISKPGLVDKNAAIFPEKIRGKYVIFHRIFPHILIDFVDDLNFDGQTKFLKGEYKISPRINAWDSRKIGTGPAPMKTKDGWLLIYHAVDDRQDNEYKMGAMLLDHNDPTKVIARSIKPILEPREWYENNGHKSGVPYPCGATIVNDELFVYYGGADSVVCVATADINYFLDQLQTTSSAKVKPVIFR